MSGCYDESFFRLAAIYKSIFGYKREPAEVVVWYLATDNKVTTLAAL